MRVRAEAPGWGIGGIGGIGGTGEIGGSGRNGSGEVGDEGLSRVYVAESGGWVREVCLEVCACNFSVYGSFFYIYFFSSSNSRFYGDVGCKILKREKDMFLL